jgi:ATP-dependent Zn protease
MRLQMFIYHLDVLKQMIEDFVEYETIDYDDFREIYEELIYDVKGF